MHRVLVVVVVLLLAANAVAAGVISADASTTSDASPVPNAKPFTLAPVLAGHAPMRLTVPPGRPVLLTFFASWCQPCVDELPLIEKVAQEDKIEVVGVDELDQRPDGPDLVRSTRVTFPTGFDHDGSVGQKYDIDGLPINVFIAPDGRIVSYHRGQMDAGQLDHLVDHLLAAEQ
jgi:cytochrome c biogenesis protein CcmG/thiol:disulfide interchange protein DsbE